MRARFVPCRRLALVAVGALGAVLSLVLASDSARVPQRTPLVPRPGRGEPVAIPLEGREGRRAGGVFRLALQLEDAAAFASHEELWLYLSGATPRQRLIAAELRVRGSECTLAARGGDGQLEGQPTVFVKAPACSRTRVSAGAADLSVEVKGDGPVSLLGFEPQPDTAPGTIQVASSGVGRSALDVRGQLVWYPASVPRLVLLNRMWRLAPESPLLLALVCAGVTLALAGCLAFPTAPLADASRAWGAPTLRAGAGAALFAASLALLYAAVAPPLSGPDEPYHLLGFADLTHNAPLAQDTVAWMGETHVWRMRQQPSERFRTIDLDRPYVVDDPDLRATEVAQRSAVLARLWRAIGPWLGAGRAPGVLMALRLVNTLVFALAVGAATAFAVAAVREPFRQWLAFPFLFVPALPYFAMHVSETALLCSLYVLLAVALTVLFLDGPRACWSGIPLGIATGLMLAAGRSPWPLVGLLVVALVGRALLGSRSAAFAVRDAAVFWGGFALGTLPFFALQDEPYRNMTTTWAMRFTTHFPGWLRSSGEWLRVRPLATAGLILAAAGLELALRRPRAWVGERCAGVARTLLRPAARALVVFLCLSLLGSLFLSYPVLPLAPPLPLTPPQRLGMALGSMATMFRLSGPDFLLSSSFWVGFGWLDTMPGPGFQAMLLLLVALALAALVLRIARRQELRRFAWLVILGTGATAALVLYTLGTQATPIALSGRYLIGWYLPVLGVIGSVLAFGPPSSAGEASGRTPAGAGRAAALLLLAGPIHVYCLCFILARYF